MPLSLEIPLGDLVEELEDTVPTALESRGVPGASISLIRDSSCVWSGGFGVKNSETKEPVTAQTIFEAYSLTKPILACRALKMCEEGVLELDRPLQEYLPRPYLEQGAGVEVVTLRMVLAHTSGLSDDVSDRRVRGTPGKRWQYSTSGYFYLQHVVDHLSAIPFGHNMKEKVLDPFGMRDSSFTTDEIELENLAQGHDRIGRLADNREITSGHADGLLTTSSDYAKFLIHSAFPSSNPYHLSESNVLEMLTEQVELEDGLSWGLGWGLLLAFRRLG